MCPYIPHRQAAALPHLPGMQQLLVRGGMAPAWWSHLGQLCAQVPAPAQFEYDL